MASPTVWQRAFALLRAKTNPQTKRILGCWKDWAQNTKLCSWLTPLRSTSCIVPLGLSFHYCKNGVKTILPHKAVVWIEITLWKSQSTALNEKHCDCYQWRPQNLNLTDILFCFQGTSLQKAQEAKQVTFKQSFPTNFLINTLSGACVKYSNPMPDCAAILSPGQW